MVDWLHWQLRYIDKNTGNGLVLSERECVVYTFSLSLTSRGVGETTCHPWKCHAHTHILADVRGICEEMSTDHLLSPERFISEVFMNWRHSAVVLEAWLFGHRLPSFSHTRTRTNLDCLPFTSHINSLSSSQKKYITIALKFWKVNPGYIMNMMVKQQVMESVIVAR